MYPSGKYLTKETDTPEYEFASTTGPSTKVPGVPYLALLYPADRPTPSHSMSNLILESVAAKRTIHYLVRCK